MQCQKYTQLFGLWAVAVYKANINNNNNINNINFALSI